MNTYKVYGEEGQSIVCKSLRDLRETFELTSEQLAKVFYPGVYNVKSLGLTIITFAN